MGRTSRYQLWERFMGVMRHYILRKDVSLSKHELVRKAFKRYKKAQRSKE